MVIDTELARKILRAVFEEGARMGLRPMTVVVADAGGHPLALERADGANPGGVDIVRNKAYAAVMMRLGGTRMRELCDETSWFLSSAQQVCDGKIFPVPGAIVIRDADGGVIGGLGVTGDTPDNDAAAGKAALERFGLVAEI
ncbi:GlcG/HbpS family heme-binding protein [Aliiruegeria sabulilitoris]|uniref:GlcG/HbpS family heme-binding protein n=1 Tax=Aliiruegeria sabulilitoris TaxID=1510458 RepID=UPI000835F9E4|nr:heme-binding protein [Aliiruegeria sabulilitoris]